MLRCQDSHVTGLVFEDLPPVEQAANRADIALFVGFVGRRATPVPANIHGWLVSRQPELGGTDRLVRLLDLPVPIDNWQVFDRLFAWDTRRASSRGGSVTTLLGAAVRSFFAQGGRKCYVVRVGEPWWLTAARDSEQRQAWLSRLIPGYPNSLAAPAMEPARWRGVAHLLGLSDVSFVCLPDLPDAVGRTVADVRPARLPQPPERFLACSTGETGLGQDAHRFFHAPRCGREDYADWARAIGLVADMLRRPAREVHLLAALPIPSAGGEPERDLLDFLVDRGRGPLAVTVEDGRPVGIASSAFVQLAYPWLRTPGSDRLPEQLESPDGVLAGLLARNALMNGTFRSAAGSHLADVYGAAPPLTRAQMFRPPRAGLGPDAGPGLIDRVSLFGATPSGLRLLSDVTTAAQDAYRPACVSRLVSVIVRAARRLGEELTFEPSGERLWARVREHLSALLLELRRAGALRGATPAESFRVRCDRSTMTQNDLDAGRVIAELEFDPALPVDRIRIVLALNEGGQVSLRSTDGR